MICSTIISEQHTNATTTEKVTKFGWTVLPLISYSSDLALSDLHFSGPLGTTFWRDRSSQNSYAIMAEEEQGILPHWHRWLHWYVFKSIKASFLQFSYFSLKLNLEEIIFWFSIYNDIIPKSQVWFLDKKISSTHVWHRVGSKDEMWWSSYNAGLWIARMPANHAWCTITRADEMELSEMNEMSVEKWWNVICGKGKWEKPREKPTQTPFHPPRNPHGVTKRWTQDPSSERWVS